jgi:O-antigen ligase
VTETSVRRMDPDTGREGFRQVVDRVAWALWLLLLLTVPFTSHPWVAALTGHAAVSPLSGIPLLLLVMFWLPWALLRMRGVPRVFLPLAAFLAVALLSCAAAVFLPILSPDTGSIIERELRALLTLIIGIGYFAVAALMPQTESQLKSSLRWVYAGALLLLAYTGFEISRLPQSFNPIPDRVVAFHRLFSIRDPLRARVTGFAFEPSWLGDQLVILYLPLLLAGVWLGYSAFSRRPRRLSIELAMLMVGVTVLFFTFARLAWLAFILMLGALLALALWNRAADRAIRPGGAATGSPPKSEGRSCLLGLGIGASVLLIAFLIIAGLVLVGAQLDTRLAASLRADVDLVFSGRHPWPYALADQLKYGERLMYWIAGFRVFSLYPLLGVGLGNVGFLMPSTVPSFAFTLPEGIDTLHFLAYGLPNTKSLWVRLLAETGLIGFGVFVGWLGLMAFVASKLLRGPRAVQRVLGLAALLSLVAQSVEGFSLDTFALPQLWIILGLMTAAARLIGSRPGSSPA